RSREAAHCSTRTDRSGAIRDLCRSLAVEAQSPDLRQVRAGRAYRPHLHAAPGVSREAGSGSTTSLTTTGPASAGPFLLRRRTHHCRAIANVIVPPDTPPRLRAPRRCAYCPVTQVRR